MAKDPYKNSPYDDGGMPLGTTTADYDNADEVRMAQVKDTYVPIPTIFDDDYQPQQFSDKEIGKDFDPKKNNTALGEESGLTEEGDIKVVDFSDPENKKEFEQKDEKEAEDTSFLDEKDEDKKEEGEAKE